jgi:ubiquinone/menaquinone biosynthesis C-methylase UbiE
MAELSKFTQPNDSAAYFVDFLNFLDNQQDIKNLRTATAKRMQVAAGQKILDLGCGIGGATFPIADITGPAGLVAGACQGTTRDRVPGWRRMRHCVS